VYECIDFTLPCPSIFDRKKQLVDATCQRVARGMVEQVLEHQDPFIVTVTHSGSDRVHGTREPLRTITTAKRGEMMVAMPSLVQMGYGERPGQAPRVLDLRAPLGTVVAGGLKHAQVAAFLAQFNGGKNTTAAHDLRKAMSTLQTRGTQQQLVSATLVTNNWNNPPTDLRGPAPVVTTGGLQMLTTAHLAHLRNNCHSRDVRDPLHTISAAGQHHAMIESTLASGLSPEHEAGALRVASFLIRYYSNGGQWGHMRDPLAAVTTKDRIALVTVWICGSPWVIVDIGLRMLVPRELFLAMGFSPGFIIDRGRYQLPGGGTEERPFTKTTQVRLCGNAVSPPPAEALIMANAPELSRYDLRERPQLMEAIA
jgi:DNA (cytosine-5)-methyltransferase 1